MEYMRGRPLSDCFENLTYLQPEKIRVGMDLALVMSSLFKIKAPQCGSISRIRRRSSIGCQKNLKLLYAQPYPIDGAGTLSHLGGLSDIIHHGFHVGPVNDVTFLDFPRQILPNIAALSTLNVNFWRRLPF